jgi:hypothetical protein
MKKELLSYARVAFYMHQDYGAKGEEEKEGQLQQGVVEQEEGEGEAPPRVVEGEREGSTTNNPTDGARHVSHWGALKNALSNAASQRSNARDVNVIAPADVAALGLTATTEDSILTALLVSHHI